MIRLSMSEGMYILNLDGNEAKKLLNVSKAFSSDTSIEKIDN